MAELYYDGSSAGILRVCGLNRSGSGKGELMGTCKYGNEHSGSIKCGKLFD